MGQGPCAKIFQGKHCPFYPDFPIMKKFYPACCDGDGCFCECMHKCTTVAEVNEMLELSIRSFEFEDCTREVKTLAEGNQWKTEMCAETNGTELSQEAVKKCRARGSKERCVRKGTCIKGICKFCFR